MSMTQTQTKTSAKTMTSLAAKSPRAAASSAQHSLLSAFVPPASNQRVVTHRELAEHDGIGSKSLRAWVCIHGQVFDVTDFSLVHPGGHSIRLAAGRDATCLVESYHPGTSINKVEQALFNKCTYVGAMQAIPDATAEKSITATAPVAAYKRPDDAFFLDVRARVETLINDKLKSSRYAFENIGCVEAAVTLLLYVIATYQVAVSGSWLWAVGLGVLTGRMGFLMHMGNHCAVSHNPNRNRLVGWFMNVAGSNSLIWGYEHQVAHHVEPNEYHHDNDCEIGAPAVRMHPEVPFDEATMPHQHIIIPIAMTFGFFKWYVGDFGHYVSKRVGNVRMALDRDDWVVLLAFKAAWFLAHVVAPVYFQGWAVAMAQLFVFMALGGHYLENIFIVNHIQNGLVPPADAHWASKQVMATANWKSNSLFWNWFSGGLNHQIEHHMFPSLSQYWYPYIAPTVKQCCLDHGLPYHDYPDFITAWVAMWTYLKDMGDINFVSKTGQHGAMPVSEANKGKSHAA